MMTTEYFVIPFNSTQQAIRAEQIVQRGQISASLIPIPREIKADCGLSLRFLPPDKERILALLREHDLPPAGLYLIKTGPSKEVIPWRE